MQRRDFLCGMAATAIVGSTQTAWASYREKPFRVHQWQRHAQNPVLPPGGGPFDVGCCMNPFVVVHGDDYFLFYAGADASDGRRRYVER